MPVTHNKRRGSGVIGRLCLLLAGLLLLADGALAETRIALVIGNGAYPEAPLDSSPRDAALMAGTLDRLGFDVITDTDVDWKRMRRLIDEFGQRLREASDAVGFFYYSGHGMQVRGRNYMIPIDAEIADEPDVQINGVGAWSVLLRMEHAGTRMNIIVLDACRNNPFEKRFKNPGEGTGLAPMQAPPGTLIAYATAPGGVADPGPIGGYSPYTEALAEELDSSDELIVQLFNDVTLKVYQSSGREQQPYVESSVVPRIAFRQSRQAPAAPSKQSTTSETKVAVGVFSESLRARQQVALPPDEEERELMFEVEEMEAPYRVTTRANVRAGPATRFEKVDTLDAGQAVTVTGKVKGSNWFRITFSGREGFIFGQLIRDEASYQAETLVTGGEKADLQRRARDDEQDQAMPGRAPSAVSKGRYVDAKGCLREADGSFVVGFRSDCR